MILVPWAPYHLSARPHLNYIRDDIDAMQKLQKKNLYDLQKTTKKVQKLNDESSTLEEENNALLFDLREHGDTVDTDNNRYREGEELEEALLKRIDTMQTAIQKRSKEAVVQAFGEGPFRIKVTLESEPENEYFIIETAPLSVMPHAVYHFMKMVKEQLWDGLSMISRSTEPILQATPLNAETNSWVDKKFDDAGVTHMAFTEYSFDYPPKKYTLAFAGRPGGPDFYVNMEELKDSTEEGESTFGIVVEGFEVLDRFMARTGRWKKHHQVAIVSIELLP
jgi:cyclophilin family peptidyl-prolyl cis-trans isomerase